MTALIPLAVHAQTPPDVAARANAEQQQQVEQRRDAQQREATVAAPVVRSTAPAAGEYPVLPVETPCFRIDTFSVEVRGAMLLVVYFVLLAMALLVLRRMVNSLGTEKRNTTGRVLRKYSIAERREWQGKALVTVPEQRMLDISVEGESLSFSPVQWKFDRVNEGEDIDVVIKVGRVDRKLQILDVGPF